jgi:hypothetical protein
MRACGASAKYFQGKHGDRADLPVNPTIEDSLGAMLADIPTPAEIEDFKELVVKLKAAKRAGSSYTSR